MVRAVQVDSEESRDTFGVSVRVSSDARLSFLYQSAILVVSTGLSAVLSAAFVAVFGHLLSPDEYGDVSAMLSLSYLFSLVLGPINMGLGKFAAHFHGENSPGKSATLIVYSLRRLGILLAIFALLWAPCVPVLRNVLHLRALGPLLWLAAFAGFSLVITVPRAILRGNHQFLAFANNQVWESVIRLVSGVACVAWAGCASGALAGYVVGLGAAFVLGMWQVRATLRTPRVPINVSRLFRVAGPVIFIYFFSIFVVNADVLAAKCWLSETAAGVYGAAASLPRLLQVGVTPLFLVLFSHVASAHAQRKNPRRLAWVSAIVLALGLVGSLALPVCWGEGVLRLAFGPAYVGGADVLLILWLAQALLMLEALTLLVLLGTDRVYRSWRLLFPCVLQTVVLCCFHETANQIALGTLGSIGVGLLFVLVMLRDRNLVTDQSVVPESGEVVRT